MASPNEKVSNHIPDDIAFSILSKLPLKSLKRFTCAQKSWTLLFENSHFMSMFRKNFISTHHSFYDDTYLLINQRVSGHNYRFALYFLSGNRFENRVRLDWPPPFQENDITICILGSGINGTFCLYNWNHRKVVLWNPVTEEFKVTPCSSGSLPYNSFVMLHGFGYDHVKNDYMVIRHVKFPGKVDSLWQIYSLRSNYWRKLNVDMPVCDPRLTGAEVYLNGVCHWLGKTNIETYVVSFNLSNEVFFTTPLPSKWVHRHLHLVMLNESIAMIYAKMASFHISILGELGIKESWTKLFIVGPLLCVERPIGAGKGDIFFRKKDKELACFNLNTQTIEEIGVKGEFCCCFQVVTSSNS